MTQLIKFEAGDLVCRSFCLTYVGVVYECDGENVKVSWGGKKPIDGQDEKIEWLVKSNYTQTQVNIMQDISPEMFLFVTEIESALSDKSSLSIWEVSVKEQCEKFITHIKNT